MYIVKNALRNISRAKGRSFLIFILILVISIAACVSLSIKESAENAKQQAYDGMSITATIGVDREAMMSQVQEGGSDRTAMMSMMNQSLSLDEMLELASSDYVENFYYTASIGFSVEEDEFEIYESDEISVSERAPEQMGGNKGGGSGQQQGGSSRNISSDVTVTGYSSHDAMSDFVSGTLNILEGSVFDIEDEENSVVISEEIAYLNGLEVGDEFVLINPLQEEEQHTFTIVGIFECLVTDAYANYMYVSYPSLEVIMEGSASVATTFENERTGEDTSTAMTTSPSGTYVLTNVATYNAFDESLESLGLDTELYTLQSSDIEAYESSVVPLENLSSFTMMFFMVVLIVGGIILVIFNLFTVRERKYEIGVLAAIGMQKPKVALQFILETVVITFAAIIIGSGIGAAASQPIADNLLASQIEASESSSASVNDNFGGNFSGRGQSSGGQQSGQSQGGSQGQEMSGRNGNSAVEYVDSVVAGINVEIFLQLIAVGMMLAILASSVGLIAILRYEPLKILSSRS